ncbi:hypothetical protein FCV25MIE_01937, partial [Fagus crenata]
MPTKNKICCTQRQFEVVEHSVPLGSVEPLSAPQTCPLLQELNDNRDKVMERVTK